MNALQEKLDLVSALNNQLEEANRRVGDLIDNLDDLKKMGLDLSGFNAQLDSAIEKVAELNESDLPV